MTRRCGVAIIRRLILGAEIVAGSDAVALGLAHWVAPAAELEAGAAALVARLAKLPRQALAASKQCIAAATDGSGDGYEIELDGSRMLLATPDTQDRVRRFLEKQ